MLQLLVDKYQLTIHICHYPLGTSKWNPVEHRLFSYISIKWHGIPLETYEIALELITNARTETGLTVEAILCEKEYKKIGKISEFDRSTMNLVEKEICDKWNYKIESRDIMDVQRKRINWDEEIVGNKFFTQRRDAKNASLEFIKKHNTEYLCIKIKTIITHYRRKDGKRGRPPKNCKMIKVYSAKLECSIIE